MQTHPEETTLTVVEMAADPLGLPYDERPPLSDSVDLEALDGVVGAVTVTYAGLRVTVYSRESADVVPPNPSPTNPWDSSEPRDSRRLLRSVSVGSFARRHRPETRRSPGSRPTVANR